MDEHLTENVNCFCREKLNLEGTLRCLKDLLKDTDDNEAKAKVDEAIQRVAAAYRVIVVGEEGAGRTSLLKHVFLGEASGEDGYSERKTHGIEEIRFGAAEVSLKVDDCITRKFSTNTRLDGLVLTDVGESCFYRDPRIKAMAEDAQVVFAVFSSENIQNPEVWSFIERYCSDKRIICILNKSDLYPLEIMEKKQKRLQAYIEEAGIQASIFMVSLKEEKEHKEGGLNKLCHYIQNSVLGKDPVVERYGANIMMVSSLIQELKHSFLQRQQQFAEDQKILLYMNEKMNDFYLQQKDKVQQLQAEVFSVIRQEIDSYRDCIIKKLDPKKLRDDMDISNKGAFKEWLQHELEKRERMLQQKVENQTQKVMRWYYDDLALVYEDVTGKLDGRKQYIALDDRFYGSLQTGKREIVEQTLQVAQSSKEDFTNLSKATEEFYQKVKRESERFDRMKRISAFVGSALSGGAAAIGAQAIGTAAAGASGAAAMAGITATLLPIMGAVVVGTAGVYAGMKLFECCYGERFEKNMEKHVADFSRSVEEIKERMINQVGERMEMVFGEMLGNVDKAFLPFRSTTNIDSRNIPLLEDKMQSMEQIFNHLIKALEAV